MSALAKRYARAAVEAAHEKGQGKAVEQLVKDLIAFRQQFLENAELGELLTNPALVNERMRVLDVLLEKAKLSETAANLVRTLAERDRMMALYDIVEAAERMADEQAKRLHAEVWSPMKLDAGQQKSLQTALEKRMGRAVLVDVNVAPELLGGLVVQIGDLKFDSSIKRQLEILRERLDAAAM
jgi:F-type H+-transporting ATPase subunit delta